MDSAAVNIGMHVSFGIMIFSAYMPRSGIAGSYGNSIIGTSVLVSTVAAQFMFPKTVCEGPLFSTFIICILFKDGHSGRCEVQPHCCFDLCVSDK